MDVSNQLWFNHAWDNVDEIVKRGYEFDNFAKIPLEKHENSLLLFLPIETDFGRLKFILDTGSSVSTIRPSVINVQKYEQMTEKMASFCTLSTFKIGGRNFANTSLALRETDATITYDGILGMDFFQNCALDLDVARRTLFIGESPKKNKKIKTDQLGSANHETS